MAGDAQHPGRETRLAAKAFKIFQHAQKGLLRDILGVLFLAQHPHGQRINTLLVTVGQRLERIQLARLGAAHQLGIGRFGSELMVHAI